MKMSNGLINVMIADDHQLYLDGVYLAMKNISFIGHIRQAHNGKEVLDLLSNEKERTDVLFIDLEMPVISGLNVIPIILKSYPLLKIIILSTHANQEIIVEMIENKGISEYLLKDKTGKIEIENAIKKVMNLTALPKPNSKLSSRELEVLYYLDKQLLTKEIAYLLYISEGAIEAHRGKLLQKAGARNIVGIINWAKENGVLYEYIPPLEEKEKEILYQLLERFDMSQFTKMAGREKRNADEYLNRLYMKSSTNTIENLINWAEKNNVLGAWNVSRME
jgi:two-component system nitrate/nitrite response regulator NarL